MNIYESITKIMEEVPAIGKDKINKQQGFKFRGIDDVMNALQPLLAKNKVFIVPEILEQIREERTTSKGGNLIYSICKIKYKFYAEDGSNIEAITIGEGMDSGDKATNKAMAIAMKYALFQVFCIPTEERKDPDGESPEESKKKYSNKQEEKIMQEELDMLVTEQQAKTVYALMMSKGLEVENLACRYKHNSYIIENLSFRIDYGEVLAITGCNGTGKTTLIRCLCGLMKEKKGKIYLDGQVVKLRKRRKQSFCVMQDVNHQLFSDSVYGECEQTGKDKKEEIDRLLEDFDLLDMKERHPMSLSGGQKQRLAIVTAILSEKRILVFDEPTSGLDYRHMCEVSAVIKKLAKAGHIVIVVSHDNEFIMSCCDKVLRICKKKKNTL